MLFGGNRLGPRMWLLATFMVVFGAHFSALWILMANSWMQTPAGLRSCRNRAVMTDFAEVVATPSFLPRLLHTWVASWMVGASLCCSVSAWYLLKHRHVGWPSEPDRLALSVFAVLASCTPSSSGPTWPSRYHQPAGQAGVDGGGLAVGALHPMFLMGWVDEATQTTTGIASRAC